MKINRKSSKTKKKAAIIVAIIVIAITGGTVAYVYVFNGNLFGWQKENSRSQDSSGDKPATKEQKAAGDATKQETVKNEDSTASSNSSDTSSSASKPSTTPADTRSNTPVSITAANQNGSTLQVRALISSIIPSGTCTIRLSQSGKSDVVKTAATQALAHNSTCQGFDIPTSELTTGTWTITLSYESSQDKGIATQEVTIR